MITIRWTSIVLAVLTAWVMCVTPRGWGLFWLAVLFGVLFLLHVGTYENSFGFLRRSWWFGDEPPTADHLTRLDELDRHR